MRSCAVARARCAASAACSRGRGRLLLAAAAGRDPALSSPRPRRRRFARATAPRAFRLPQDHGPHFEFQTEWWYYTGNLGRGRRGASASSSPSSAAASRPAPPPATGPRHQPDLLRALRDHRRGGRRRHAFGRALEPRSGGPRRARAREPFRVWLEDWTVETPRTPTAASVASRGPRRQSLRLDLELAATKPLVAHGDRGLSPKSDEPGNASYYVGYTRHDRARADRRGRAERARRPARPGSTTSGARARSGRRPWAGTGSACSSTTGAS